MLSKIDQREFYRKVGMIIKSSRLEKQVSQEQLAELLGFKSRISIANIESGKQNVQLHSLVEISDFLKVPVAQLLPDNYKPLNKISRNITKKIEQSLNEYPDASAKVSDFVRSLNFKK